MLDASVTADNFGVQNMLSRFKCVVISVHFVLDHTEGNFPRTCRLAFRAVDDIVTDDAVCDEPLYCMHSVLNILCVEGGWMITYVFFGEVYCPVSFPKLFQLDICGDSALRSFLELSDLLVENLLNMTFKSVH